MANRITGEVNLPAKLAIHLTHKQAILLNMMYGFGSFSFCGNILPAMVMRNSISQFLDTHWTDKEKQEMASMISAIAELVPEDVRIEFGCNNKITGS